MTGVQTCALPISAPARTNPLAPLGIEQTRAPVAPPPVADVEAEAAAERAAIVAESETPALVTFGVDVAAAELPGECVGVWIKHRAALHALEPAQREAAWRALCARTEVVGKMKGAKTWLKKAIAERDAATAEVQP